MLTTKNLFACLVFVLAVHVLHAQETEVRKWKYVLQLDNRFSSIQRNDILIFGTKTGFQYKNRLHFGLGASLIFDPVTVDYFNKKTGNEEINTMEFWYGSLFGDWILYKNQQWECFLTEQIGFGKPNFTRTIDDEIVSDVNVNIFVNEFSGQVNYKIRPWIGVGAGFGYRNSLNGSSQIKRALNAPVYIVKIVLYPQIFFNKI